MFRSTASKPSVNPIQITHVQSSTIEPELTQMQSSIPLPNYVIVTDCNPTISAIQGVNKQYGNGITSFLGTQSIQPNGLAYSLNSMGILDGLTNGGYAIQQVSVPVRVPTTTMYQTFNVPPNGFAQPITGTTECLCRVIWMLSKKVHFSFISSPPTNSHRRQSSGGSQWINSQKR